MKSFDGKLTEIEQAEHPQISLNFEKKISANLFSPKSALAYA